MNKEELKKLEDLKALSETAGGIYLRDTAKESVLSALQVIVNSYHEKSHIELVTMCSKLSANLSMFQLLTGLEKQIEAIKELYKEE